MALLGQVIMNKCVPCDAVFKESAALDIHMNNVHGESPCNKLSRQNRLKENTLLSETTERKKYICSICKTDLSTDAEMENHMENEHKGLPNDDKAALAMTSELTAMFDSLPDNILVEDSDDDVTIENVKTETYPKPRRWKKGSLNIRECS